MASIMGKVDRWSASVYNWTFCSDEDEMLPTRTLSWTSHLYIALVGCVMKTRPLKLVLARTYGKEAA